MTQLFTFVMMKKPLVIMLLMLYGFSSTGMTVQLHYCCGKLKNIEWVTIQKKDCGNEHKMGSKPCCETKEISNKENFDQLTSVLVFEYGKTTNIVRFINHSDEKALFTGIISPANFSPSITSPPIYLFQRVFRI